MIQPTERLLSQIPGSNEFSGGVIVYTVLSIAGLYGYSYLINVFGLSPEVREKGKHV